MSQTKFKPVAEQLEYLKKGVAEIIREDEFVSKLRRSHDTGKPLRAKLGVDPTAPDIHLGHMVVIEKLRQFQILGHKAVFLVGDFTAMVGDPTGQSETRPPLSREQVNANAKTYLDQVFKILDPKRTEIRYNSEWLDKLTSYEIVRLCAKYRVARMLEREDFRSRLDKGQPISVHELLYPLLTAIDAVKLQSDVELGATEQKFNLLVHREIQREYGLPGQAILTMPILVGLDGSRKMSKSLGNYVGITESPEDMFGKLMSIPDSLMWSYLELLTDRPANVIENLKTNVQAGTTHPKQVKVSLASEIVREFYGEKATTEAAQAFQRVYSERQAPEQMRMKRISGGLYTEHHSDGRVVQHVISGSRKWSQVLAYIGETESISKAERVIEQGGLEINGEVVADTTAKLDSGKAATYDLR